MISKIQLKRFDGSVIFEYEDKDNSVKKTLEVYIKRERAKGKENVDLTYTDLSFADLNNTDLTDADLSNADLSFADLTDADLSNADLSNAVLSFADLIGTNLSYSNLIGADLRNADLKGANLSNADFSNAILNSVRNIQQASCCFTGHDELGRQLLAIKINDEIRLFCGCFNGNEAELRKYIEEGDEKYKASRLIALDTVLKLIEL